MDQATQNALPQFFIDALADSYSQEDTSRIVEGLQDWRVSSLRANTLLADAAEVSAALQEASIAFEHVGWYKDAFILPHNRARDLWELDVYKAGKLYLQSLSSMIPPLVVSPKAGEDILDMCAAPGGKTTQMAALGGKGCHITACEMHAPRADKLEHNLEVQGARNVNVLRTDARRLDSWFSFDKVLLDAPCSGSGTICALDPKLNKRFNEGLLAKCRKQQAALLDKALQVVKPGGTVVYSTCSVLKCENEDQVQAAIKKASKKASYRIEPVTLASTEGIPVLPGTIDGALTVCPTNLYEGFFCCKILRTA